MKKSIICLGIALVTFSNFSFASNENQSNKSEIATLYSSTTPLCIAISKGENDFAKKIIEYGASYTEKSNGMTPLMVAARYNNTEIVEYLLAKGVSVTEKDDKGYTALKYAELSGAKEAAALLKKA